MRISSTTISDRGTGLTKTFTSAGGLCNGAFVFVGSGTGAGTPPASVTYGGQSMTLLSNVNNDVSATNISVWGLQNCPTGTQTVVITQSASSVETEAGASTYNNVDKVATFPNVQNTGHNQLTSLTVSVTTTTDDCFLIGIGIANTAGGTTFITAGTGTTSVSNDTGVLTGVSFIVVESNPLDVGVAGSYSLQTTIASINQRMALAVCGITTSSAPISQPTFFPLF